MYLRTLIKTSLCGSSIRSKLTNSKTPRIKDEIGNIGSLSNRIRSFERIRSICILQVNSGKICICHFPIKINRYGMGCASIGFYAENCTISVTDTKRSNMLNRLA
jgi:hypothetical protein